jgi:hypothetical protein
MVILEHETLNINMSDRSEELKEVIVSQSLTIALLRSQVERYLKILKRNKDERSDLAVQLALLKGELKGAVAANVSLLKKKRK